jgi:hypothetical protein
MVRHAGFEPALSRILSSRPLPIGLLTHEWRRERDSNSRSAIWDIAHRSAGRDRLESSSGVEPLSVRLEGAGPKSVGEDIGADDEN